MPQKSIQAPKKIFIRLDLGQASVGAYGLE
jgi:hypothetical protein